MYSPPEIHDLGAVQALTLGSMIFNTVTTTYGKANVPVNDPYGQQSGIPQGTGCVVKVGNIINVCT